MPLSPTARLVLGMLRLGYRNGYEIKQLADVSARFFWSVSYGQLYPELKKLEEAGLVAGEDDPSGNRRRRSYRLTEAGERALDEWLTGPEELSVGVRDEGLLKLFFSDGMTPERRLELVRSIRAPHEKVVETLSSIEPHAREHGGGPHMTLRCGLAFHGSMVDICNDLERELEAEIATR